MRSQLQKQLEGRVQQCVSHTRDFLHHCPSIELKKECCSKRNAEIVKAAATGRITEKKQQDELGEVFYRVHFQYLIRQKGEFFLEEEIEHRKAEFYKGILVEDGLVTPPEYDLKNPGADDETETGREAGRVVSPSGERQWKEYRYNRLKAVQYAERWWNDANPAFKDFDVDCTNYISQCLHAGGAPMHGFPGRTNGWWMQNNDWSYSWTVANSLRIYLSRPKFGLKAREVKSADQLLLGDVICYDFQGDGRYDHATIVTAKDADGMPLVNAHTTNSRRRYWAYEDSTAYTPNIQYRFFSILDNQ
ncbi:amidase domain-containing protein [Mesobacillus zeae]|uniref:Putative amidase domain-containing protein n=1 Tax=Mesobacillus zeae TaxID=1917180 RepID=A0A398AUV7_9BACI|nr:amidase domain-containing protein [Mesobacillus zeae]RID81485.1 hypothetical protein D1970_21740 [Mesobacillus zeae]